MIECPSEDSTVYTRPAPMEFAQKYSAQRTSSAEHQASSAKSQPMQITPSGKQGMEDPIWGAGAAFSTTAAYAYVVEYAQEQARGLIGTSMSVTGSAGSVFSPVTAFLDHSIGWRDASLVYAAVMASAVGPSLWFGSPATEATAAGAARPRAGSHGRIF
ncbi:hypothetical protein OY671_010041, partial [Metschnikowia pulcherrima]